MKIARAADVVSIAAVLVTCALGAYGIATLPDTIATHLSGTGVGYGSKWELLLQPFIAIAAFFFLGFVSRRPVQQMNLLVPVTPQNLPRIEPLARAMLACVRADVTLLFASIEFVAVEIAHGTLSPFITVPFWLALLLLATIAGFIVAIVRAGGAAGETGKT